MYIIAGKGGWILSGKLTEAEQLCLGTHFTDILDTKKIVQRFVDAILKIWLEYKLPVYLTLLLLTFYFIMKAEETLGRTIHGEKII